MADNKNKMIMNNNLAVAAAAPSLPVSKDNKTPPPPPPPPPPAAAVRMTLIVCLWALFNACLFAAACMATLIITNRTPCTKSTWLYRCLPLTDAAAAAVTTFLLYGELLYSAVTALAAAPPLLDHDDDDDLRSRATSRWAAAAIDALAWVALAATAGKHCMKLASYRIGLAAAPAADPYIFNRIVLGSVCLAVDMLAGILLCCSPRPRKLGEQV